MFRPRYCYDSNRSRVKMNEALRVTESANSQDTRCAFCHDSVSLENEYRCSGCEVLIHQDCCSQLTECPTLGCSVSLPQRQEQVGERLGTVVGALEGPREEVNNFSHFVVGAKALSKLAYKNLPVLYLATALVCMFLGLVLGEIYYQFSDLSQFEGAFIIKGGSPYFYETINNVIHISERYLERLHSDRLQLGGYLGFFIGLFLRFIYLAVAAFGRRVEDVSEIKEKIKKKNSKSA